MQLQVRGRQSQGTKSWCQQKPLVTSVICFKFRKNLFQVCFYKTIFMILYMYIASRLGLTTPCGWNFDVNRNIFSLRSFVASFKKSLWSLILYNFFHDFIHAYSPWAGVDSPQGTKFWFEQKCLVTSFICCKFKNKKTIGPVSLTW